MGLVPTKRAFTKWDNSTTSDDFLQLSEPGGQVVSWIDGSGSLQGALASGVGFLQKVSVTIQAAQMLSLNTLPVQLLPATPGKTYVINSIVFQLNFGTTPYTLGTSSLRVSYGLDATNAALLSVGAGVLGGSVSGMEYSTAFILNIPATKTLGSNVQLINNNSGELTLGDSSFTVTLSYFLI